MRPPQSGQQTVDVHQFLQDTGLERDHELPGLDGLIWDTVERTRADLGAIILFGADRELIASSAGLVLPPNLRTSGLLSPRQVRHRQVLTIEDLRYDVRTGDSPLVLGPPFLRGFAAARITVRKTLVIGVIALAWTKPRLLGPDSAYLRSSALLAGILLNSMWPEEDEPEFEPPPAIRMN